MASVLGIIILAHMGYYSISIRNHSLRIRLVAGLKMYVGINGTA